MAKSFNVPDKINEVIKSFLKIDLEDQNPEEFEPYALIFDSEVKTCIEVKGVLHDTIGTVRKAIVSLDAKYVVNASLAWAAPVPLKENMRPSQHPDRFRIVVISIITKEGCLSEIYKVVNGKTEYDEKLSKRQPVESKFQRLYFSVIIDES